jgi:hypothetical protein
LIWEPELDDGEGQFDAAGTLQMRGQDVRSRIQVMWTFWWLLVVNEAKRANEKESKPTSRGRDGGVGLAAVAVLLQVSAAGRAAVGREHLLLYDSRKRRETSEKKSDFLFLSTKKPSQRMVSASKAAPRARRRRNIAEEQWEESKEVVMYKLLLMRDYATMEENDDGEVWPL